MYNKITLIGSLVKDSIYSTKYNSVKFCVATNENAHRAFFNCILQGNLAQNIHTKLQKGSKVFLQGRLVQKTYNDKKQNGIYYIIMVEEIRTLNQDK